MWYRSPLTITPSKFLFTEILERLWIHGSSISLEHVCSDCLGLGLASAVQLARVSSLQQNPRDFAALGWARICGCRRGPNWISQGRKFLRRHAVAFGFEF
jgi:hypothetical protein